MKKTVKKIDGIPVNLLARLSDLISLINTLSVKAAVFVDRYERGVIDNTAPCLLTWRDMINTEIHLLLNLERPQMTKKAHQNWCDRIRQLANNPTLVKMNRVDV